MKVTTEKDRLASHARDLKKAFILASCMIGRPLAAAEALLPEYRAWEKARLRGHVADLESDVASLMDHVMESSHRVKKGPPLRWLVSRFDRWASAGLGSFTLCDVQEFEKHAGVLRGRELIEIPPYAEIWLQPPHSFAFRHPEYMLARDLSALLAFYSDAESLCQSVDSSEPADWAPWAGENCQGLARTVVQTCFNLLESFVSGLALEHVMTRSIDDKTRERLRDTRQPLSRRIILIPALITGRASPLDPKEDPLASLFGEIKRRRDAFVHCEPGASISTRGYVKEAAFHDVGPDVVRLAVRSTHEVIRRVWEFVHGRTGPRWLPALDDEGRLAGSNLRLVPHTQKAV